MALRSARWGFVCFAAAAAACSGVAGPEPGAGGASADAAAGEIGATGERPLDGPVGRDASMAVPGDAPSLEATPGDDAADASVDAPSGDASVSDSGAVDAPDGAAAVVDAAGEAAPDSAPADAAKSDSSPSDAASDAPSCGDGVVNQGAGVEQCDDGNKIDDDACTNSCKTPKCDTVDGSTHPAIVAMAANLGGGQSLATAMANNLVPGLSVALRDEKGTVYAAVFGNANNQAYDPAAPPLSPSTLFQAASIGKSVAALAYLLDPDSTKTLDTDIAPAVKGFVTLPYPITPADLLSHAAGTAPHGFGSGYAETDPLPTTKQIVLGLNPATTPAVTFTAAKVGVFSYSGGGYMLWQAWLEGRSNKALPAYVREHLLAAAGATRSTYTQPLLAAAEHDASCGRSPLLTKTTQCRKTYPEHSAAGLWTTPSELACVAGYVTGHRPAVLSVVRSRALTVDFNNGNYPQKMGVGLFHRPANGVDEKDGHFFEHSGVNEGFLSQSVFFDDGRAIVAMDNGMAAGGGISGFTVRALCRELKWPCSGKAMGP